MITQDELVEIAEFSPVALSRIERGINRASFENLVALSYALKVSPNYLTGWDEKKSSAMNAERKLLLNDLMCAQVFLSAIQGPTLLSINKNH